MNTENIVSKILNNLTSFRSESDIDDRLSKVKNSEDFYVLVNNSFPFREKSSIKTKKSSKYLAFPAEVSEFNADSIHVLEGPIIQGDFGLAKKDDVRISTDVKISEAVTTELTEIGTLVFVLIGEVDDTVKHERPMNHEVYKKLRLSPTSLEMVSIQNDTIECKELRDLSETWSAISSKIQKQKALPDESLGLLKEAFSNSADEIRKESYANLIIPKAIEQDRVYFLDETAKAVRSQLVEYKSALERLSGPEADRSSLNEVLRIAYNFTDDAAKLIRLFVSVGDLKPIVIWGTFLSHFRLSEALKNLPWARKSTKPQLSDYISTIGKARNRAFHRLLPFSKSFEVVVPDRSIRDFRIRIFSEFSGKSAGNRVDFKDKEFVDVLMEFSRTSEESVGIDFWQRNADVIERTVELVESTSQFLKECFLAQNRHV